MAETNIEWTDFTVNFWWGCTKVGPGCDHCYAETWDKRVGGSHWGVGADRRKIMGAPAMLRKINRNAGKFHAEHGRWPNVFMHSMSDVFDNAVPQEWRDEACAEIDVATDVRVQIVTKRVGNVEKMVPAHWLTNWPQHVGLMITVVNQDEADRDIPKLLALKARLGIPWVGLSMEPLLGQVTLRENWLRPDLRHHAPRAQLDWIIVGGESGPHARPMHPDWARSIRDQCEAAGVPFLFKQWGEYVQADSTVCPDSYMGTNKAIWLGWNGEQAKPSHHGLEKPIGVIRIGKARAGRKLDGRTHDDMPGVK